MSRGLGMELGLAIGQSCACHEHTGERCLLLPTLHYTDIESIVCRYLQLCTALVGSIFIS